MTVTLHQTDSVEALILPPVRDLGDGFEVRRALPSAHRRMIGPFIFFDQMGPAVFHSGHGLDVRPHPHIGLATVTYLLEGEIVHRDSLGSVQTILAGEVNWMTAGAGIVHSERTAQERRASGSTLFGLQTWIALPTAYEEVAPAFTHHAAAAIPKGKFDGAALTVIVGRLDGLVSPVQAFSETIYADVSLSPGGRFQIRADHVERAIYVVDGHVEADGRSGSFRSGELVVFKPGAEIVLSTERGARLVLIGGEPLPEKRHIYWNFVSSRRERIDQAKADWRAGRFASVPDDIDSILLPDEPMPVRYP